VKLCGILVAAVTPLDSDGEAVDHASIPALCEHLLDGGVSGVIPCGSTGEFATMTLGERMSVVESFADAIAGRAALVPHIGAVRTADAVRLMRHAASVGAAAVMAVPPYYDPLPWGDIIAYHAAIADAAPQIPIMAYHFPSATGGRVGIAELDVLVEQVPSVRYLKDSSGDAVLLDELLAHFRGRDLNVFNGWDSLTFQGLCGGATGSVWGAASFMPRLAVSLFDAIVEERDLSEGSRLWSLVRPICRLLEESVYPAAVKAACELVGLAVGPPRAPLSPTSPDVREQLRGLLVAAGLVEAAETAAAE
jgi:dihydrodipicolinate synthase/N-acetylneuraminate lyase